jgi:WXG100 family type VII secretion target
MSLGSDLRVGGGALSGASSKLNGNSQEIQATLSRIKSEVANLEAQWQGRAQGAFNAFYVEWDRGGQQIQQALTNLASKLGVADVNYGDTESANTKLFAS